MGSQLSCDGADHCNAGGGGCTKWIVSGVLASSKLLVDGDTTDQSGDQVSQDLENGGQIVVLAYFISRPTGAPQLYGLDEGLYKDW
uniref:Uncharacterized protein n=2 Tax=Oryza sativa subsp. japonica TaxID=39947 RepID=Q2R601_ORYSJ|nr:hypothetical protein LOC_Os11g22760 [Oryza sativa Japonica Group]AAX96605.1 hypothetical protein [Oryza sativa Japonica Group]ABA92989.1 hypothetical protein LOC_Os11g22760 [Oryza sativa Japonica Group]